MLHITPQKIVIIGAGVSGLAAAHHLVRHLAIKKEALCILEAAHAPGGLLRSTYQGNSFWDHGVFVFPKSGFLPGLFPDLFSPIKDMVLNVLINGQIVRHPPSPTFLFRQHRLSMIFTTLTLPYYFLRYKSGYFEQTLDRWLCNRLTRSCMRLLQFDIYLKKLQGLSLQRLSASFGEDRLDFLRHPYSFRSIRKQIIQPWKASKKEKQNSENCAAKSVYPATTGVGEISRRLAGLCMEAGVKINYGSKVVSIRPLENTRLKITTSDSKRIQTLQTSNIISTMPIDKLVTAYQGHLSLPRAEILRHLSYRDLLLLFLTVKKTNIPNKHFILYSFDERHKWKRLVAIERRSGFTDIVIEITLDKNESVNTAFMLSETERQLTEELALFEKALIVTRLSKRVSGAYSIYTLGFEKILKTATSDFHKVGIFPAGQTGIYKTLSTGQSAASGINAADNLVAKLKIK